MKKILAFAILAVVVAATAFAAVTPSTGTVDATFDPNNNVAFDQQTNEKNRVITIGKLDSSIYKTPVLVTSFGQSTDASMMNTVMKKVKVNYTYNATATAADLAGVKTVIIAVGASTKGLGAAGISEADETARAKAFMAEVKKQGIQVICAHIGGSARRGSLSDLYSDMVMEVASYIVLKEDANFDGKFTNFAASHNVPITLIYGSKDTVDVFTGFFK